MTTFTFYPVTVCRSDGLREVITKNGLKELNQPTPMQLTDKPDAKGNVDYYRRIPDNDPKSVEWRRKIGGMLMRTLGCSEHADRHYLLKEMPEGYVLWEHVKYNKNKALDEKKKSKHAGGPYERQDAYLYGHPQGRKKRFRSPADFFPHALWLSSDKSGDPANCTCKMCSPEGEEEYELVKKETRILPPTITAPKLIANLISHQPISAPVQPLKPAYLAASKPKSREQLADSEPAPKNKYIYRPGELVWFNNGANWRLGVIGKRGMGNNQLPRYLIQPLSNPVQHQELQIKDQEALRPWLAWSVPNTTITALRNMNFDQVPWDRIIQGEFDAGQATDYVVDGSILAAKIIDASHSLFDRIENALVGAGDVSYNGMFLGAEKIWVGEPVRLKDTANDIVVMTIQRMIEHTGPPSSVTFVGDVHKLVEMPNSYAQKSDWPPPNPNLPPRMIADIYFRNEVAAKRQSWFEWRLLEPAAKKALNDIKGRWYETQTLLPILKGASKYQLELNMGHTSDTGEWMNGRRDNNQIPEQRKKNRKETLGRAVPGDFKVSRGLDGLPADDEFPDEQQSPPPPSSSLPLQTGLDNLDHFMDFDESLYSVDLQH